MTHSITDSQKLALEAVYKGDKKRDFPDFSHLSKALGSILSKGHKHLRTAGFITTACVPYYIFTAGFDRDDFWFEYVGLRFEDELISLAEAEKRFKSNASEDSKSKRDYGVIGYDAEFRMFGETASVLKTLSSSTSEEIDSLTYEDSSNARKTFADRGQGIMLSHQFCIDTLGKRLAFVICTEHRFTDEEFFILLRDMISRISGASIATYKVFAHFSLIESSWLDNRAKKIIQRSDKKWSGKYKIIEEEELLPSGTVLPVVGTKNLKDERERITRRAAADKLVGVPFLKTGRVAKTGETKGVSYSIRRFKCVYLQLCDTLELYPGSLSNAAESCGFGKVDLPDGVIEKMDIYKAEHFEDFCRYGSRDAIVTAGIAVDIHSRFSSLHLAFQPRISKYSESYFRNFYQTNYAPYGDWRGLLGQVEGYENNRKRWMPGRTQVEVLDLWYHGGRNEVRRVGCFDEAYYWDLKSAYPTAAIMLYRDYDYSRTKRFWNSEASKEIAKLRKLGPFQPHGVTLNCVFKKTAIPLFPVNESGSIIFPRYFHGVACWPEFWTALELDILEPGYTIIHLDTFAALTDRHLALDMKRLLEKRREDKLLYKNLLNYNYGKTVQGVAKREGWSTIACPALGAYMTSVCRAAVGELANLNADYYGITTDGFISPRPTREALKLGRLNQMVDTELKTIGYNWIELEAMGTTSFFIKTRGYSLVNTEAYLLDKKSFKKANMGTQCKSVEAFITQLNAGSGLKTSFAGFSTLRAGEIATKTGKHCTIDTTYDFKFLPIASSLKLTTFTLGQETLTIPSFDTQPVKDVHEYRHLRQISKMMQRGKITELKKVGLTEKEYLKLFSVHALTKTSTIRLCWEFRKELAREFNGLTLRALTTFKPSAHSKLKGMPLYPVVGDAPLEDYAWLFKTELLVIKDKKHRETLKKKILAKIGLRYTRIAPVVTEDTEDLN